MLDASNLDGFCQKRLQHSCLLVSFKTCTNIITVQFCPTQLDGLNLSALRYFYLFVLDSIDKHTVTVLYIPSLFKATCYKRASS